MNEQVFSRVVYPYREGRDEVDVTVEVWDEMVHVWHLFADVVPEGREAIARVAAYLEGRWGH